MTTVNPEADAKHPSRHFGVVIGSAYLVFLFFPIGSVLGATTGGNTVLGLAVIVVFAIIYISLFWASRDLGFPVQRLYPRVMGGLMAMTVITGVMVTWIGPEMTGLATFIVGSLLYVLPIPWGYYAAMAAVGLTVVALLATDGLREYWFFVPLCAVIAAANVAVLVFVPKQMAFDEAQKELAMMRDRSRVARDVHDVLGHTLTALALKAQVAERLVESDPPRAKAEIREIHELSRSAIAEVRRTVTGLRGEDLSSQLVAASSTLTDAGVALTITGEVEDVPQQRRPLCAAVVREAVTNVVRHAHASTVLISLSDNALRIIDDGVGRRDEREGNGLRGLRERVSTDAATLRWAVGEQGRGTRLVVVVIRVLLADDQALVRGALAALLSMEPDLEVVAEVNDGTEVVAAARDAKADVCLLDIEMPAMDGITATEEVTRALPGVKCLIVTTFGRPGYLRRALASGASGFVVKHTPAAQLADAVRRVHSGLRVVDPALAAESMFDGDNPLTARETEVLRAAATGKPVSVVATMVHLSPGTVRNHLSSAMAKTGASTRAEAVRISTDRGWL